jgi:hypothetical protein
VTGHYGDRDGREGGAAYETVGDHDSPAVEAVERPPGDEAADSDRRGVENDHKGQAGVALSERERNDRNPTSSIACSRDRRADPDTAKRRDR